MEEVHLFESALRGPMFESNAIGGHEHASAVVAQPAMNVHRFSRPLLQERKELNKFFVLRRRPAAGTNVDEVYAACFRPLSFRCYRALPLAAEIHDGGDSDFFQLFDALFIWLRAAIKKIVDLAHVGNAMQLDFLRKGRGGGTGRFVRARGTCATGNEKRSKKQSKNFVAWVLHKERPFNHLDGNCKCKLRGEECQREISNGNCDSLPTEKAPLDIDAVRKSHPHFAFFS